MSGATIPAQLGKYEIRGVLGKGAMGTVYDGWDPAIHRRVAIKTVPLPNADDEEAMEGLARFKREAQAAGRLSHPNIVGVFDYGETEVMAFIVMEFVEGKSLKEMLGAHERMAAADAIRLMDDVLAGLAYSHGRGVVHRDIKPANIMMTTDNQAKIADFGIARIEASSMTQAGTVMGTPAYMSPEQFMGQVVDLRTDLYSCGVMLYQLLTGERPFEGSMTSIMHKAMTTTPPAPSALAVTAPARLDGVVAQAMARRPEDRFASASAFAKALHAPPATVALDEDPPAGDETIVAPRARPPAPVSSTPAATAAPTASYEGAATLLGAAKTSSRLPLFAAGGVGVLAVAGIAAWLLLPAAKPGDARLAQAPTAVVPAPIQSPTPMASNRAPPAVSAPPVSTSPVSSSPAFIPPAPTPAITTQAAPVQTAPTPPAQSLPPRPEVATSTAPTKSVVPLDSTIPAPSAPQQMASAEMARPPAPLRPPAVALSLLAGSLPGIGCSLTHAILGSSGTVTVSGLAGAGQPLETVRQAVTAAAPTNPVWQVQSVDGPYCQALDLLRPLAESGSAEVSLTLEGGPAPLLDNQVIATRVIMPGFAGFLHVAYLQHDQTVSPLVPGAGYPSQTYAARAAIPLGQPRADFPGWLVGPPFGTDMIVAIASTAPLFAHPLPDSQPLSAYLGSLQAAIDALRRRGGTVAATAMVLETRPGR